jgi:hypothetical protein
VGLPVTVPERGLEPLRISPPDPKSGASANFATPAESNANNATSAPNANHFCLSSACHSNRGFKPQRWDVHLPLDAADKQIVQREGKKAFSASRGAEYRRCGYYDTPTRPSKKKDREKVVSLVTKDPEAVENAIYSSAPECRIPDSKFCIGICRSSFPD